MFYDYAVDPICYSNWDSFQSLEGQFGWEKGRLIAEFPKNKWIKIVTKLLNDNPKKLTPEQKRKIDVEIERFSMHKNRFFVRSDYRSNALKEWVLNDVINYSELFHAIVACDKPRNHDSLLMATDLAYAPLWNIESDDIVAFEPNNLCRCVEKLLMVSQRILFIDPLFKPDKERWILTLEKFISVATSKRTPILEYHLKIDDKEYIKPENERKANFEEECNKYIKKILPHGRKLTLFRWSKIDHSGDKFHARYILTEHGGVGFDVGLDSGGSGETTDVRRLSEKTRLRRWNSFQEGSKIYEYVDKVDVVGE